VTENIASCDKTAIFSCHQWEDRRRQQPEWLLARQWPGRARGIKLGDPALCIQKLAQTNSSILIPSPYRMRLASSSLPSYSPVAAASASSHGSDPSVTHKQQKPIHRSLQERPLPI